MRKRLVILFVAVAAAFALGGWTWDDDAASTTAVGFFAGN